MDLCSTEDTCRLHAVLIYAVLFRNNQFHSIHKQARGRILLCGCSTSAELYISQTLVSQGKS